MTDFPFPDWDAEAIETLRRCYPRKVWQTNALEHLTKTGENIAPVTLRRWAERDPLVCSVLIRHREM